MNLRTLRVIEYNKIVEMLTTFASSPMAKRKCQRIKPRKDLAMIEALQQGCLKASEHPGQSVICRAQGYRRFTQET